MADPFDEFGPMNAGALGSRFQLGAGDQMFKSLDGANSYNQILGGVVPGTGAAPPVRPGVIADVKAVHVEQFNLSNADDRAALGRLSMELMRRQLLREAGVTQNLTLFSSEHGTFIRMIEWIEIELKPEPVPELSGGQDLRATLPPRRGRSARKAVRSAPRKTRRRRKGTTT